MTTNIKVAQLQTFQLAGAGVSAGDSTMTLTSFNQIDGTPLAMSNFGIVGYGTVEPASGINEEQVSFTGVTSNIDGSVTLTGIKTVLDVFPYTESSNFASGHAGGVAFVISNTSGFYNKFGIKANDETITGVWSVPTPTIPAQVVPKSYVDAAVISGGVPADTATPGISIEATQADIQAKTASRTYLGTPYELFVNPATMSATLYSDYKADTGAANAYVITPVPAVVAYVAGQQFTFKVLNTNTGASTLAVSGLSATPILKNNGLALTGSELIAGSLVTVLFDGTNFGILSTTAGTAASGLDSGGTFYVDSTHGSFSGGTPGNFFTKSLPANSLTVGRKLHLDAVISVTGSGGAGGNVTISLGGTALYSTGAISINSTINYRIEMILYFLTATTVVISTQIWNSSTGVGVPTINSSLTVPALTSARTFSIDTTTTVNGSVDYYASDAVIISQ